MTGLGIYLGGGQYVNPDTGAPASVLAMTDADSGSVRRIPVAFLPHGIAMDPRDPDRVAVFEKRGPGACAVSLSGESVLQAIQPAEGCHFYGHGVFSRDGSQLFATETRLDDRSGRITVRDAQSFAILDLFPSHGQNPHDCLLIDEGRVLAITNGGGVRVRKESRGCVTLVDITTRKLLRRIDMPDDRFNTGHLRLLPDGTVAVGSAPSEGLATPYPGAVSLAGPDDARLRCFTKPGTVVGRMIGESLSLAYEPTQHILAVTHPDGNMVTFWSLAQDRLLKALSLEKPRGIALSPDGASFLVAFGPKASLIAVDAVSLQPRPETLIEYAYLSGSHICSLSELRASVLAA